MVSLTQNHKATSGESPRTTQPRLEVGIAERRRHKSKFRGLPPLHYSHPPIPFLRHLYSLTPLAHVSVVDPTETQWMMI